MWFAEPVKLEPAATPMVGAAAAVKPWQEPQVAVPFQASAAFAVALNVGAVATPPEWQ
jgi:hypothetical protein